MDFCCTADCEMLSDVPRRPSAAETGYTSHCIIREYADEVPASEDLLSNHDGIHMFVHYLLINYL